MVDDGILTPDQAWRNAADRVQLLLAELEEELVRTRGAGDSPIQDRAALIMMAHSAMQVERRLQPLIANPACPQQLAEAWPKIRLMSDLGAGIMREQISRSRVSR